jgi:hypothetical protein
MQHRLYQQKRRQAARIVIAQLHDDPLHADRAEDLEHLRREIEIDDDAASEEGEP